MLFIAIGRALFVASAAVRAGGASASAGGYTLLFVLDHSHGNEHEKRENYEKNYYRADVIGKQSE